jgi:hypothetical protein
MLDAATRRVLGGGFFIILGLVLIIFHDSLRKLSDWKNKNDPLLRWGDWWTGKYTRGGLIFTRVVTILFGLFSLVVGMLVIFRVVD